MPEQTEYDKLDMRNGHNAYTLQTQKFSLPDEVKYENISLQSILLVRASALKRQVSKSDSPFVQWRIQTIIPIGVFSWP